MAVAPEELQAFELFAGVALENLAPLAAGLEDRWLEPGEPLATQGEPAESVVLLLEGEVDVHAAGDGPAPSDRRNVAPTYMGAIGVLLDAPWAVGMHAVTRCRIAHVPGATFLDFVHGHRSVERSLAGSTFATMQRIEGVARRQEKLAALGTMAAGLAHELNNPAAAARRTVGELADALDTVQATLGTFVEAGVERAEAAELIALQREALARGLEAEPLDPLEAGEREEALGDRLEALGVPDPWTISEPLAAAGLDEAWLDRVAALAGAATGAAVRWVAASLTARGLADELRESTDRISGLVAAVKAYAYMDQGSVQEVDVHEGLESTLTVLGHKLKVGSVEVERDYGGDVPRISASGSELNQVWTNLLDNAIDALGGSGTLTIRTRRWRDGAAIEVEIADTGSGIAPDALGRAFDPFFTTKDVGAGTGLGLDTARRIVADRHGGTLTLESDGPGAGAVARVVLPVGAGA